jgi:hypothetical protein
VYDPVATAAEVEALLASFREALRGARRRLRAMTEEQEHANAALQAGLGRIEDLQRQAAERIARL